MVRARRFVAGVLVALSAHGVSIVATRGQQPSAPGSQPAQAQCAYNSDAVRRCGLNLDQCTSSAERYFRARNSFQQEIDALKARTCAEEQEPRWREIVSGVVVARLRGLKRTPTAANCESFDWEIANNARVLLKGKVRDIASVRAARADLERALPGVQIEDGQVRSFRGECPIEFAPGFAMETGPDGPRKMDREALGDERIARLPPAGKCQDLGAEVAKLASPEIRAIAEKGFWVLDDGYPALCRKSPTSASGAWEVTKENLGQERGGVVLRETE